MEEWLQMLHGRCTNDTRGWMHKHTQRFPLKTQRKAIFSIIKMDFLLNANPSFSWCFDLFSAQIVPKLAFFMSMLFSDIVNLMKDTACSPGCCYQPSRLSRRHHQSEVFTALRSAACYCCSPIRLINTWLKKRCAVREQGLDLGSFSAEYHSSALLHTFHTEATEDASPCRSEVRVTQLIFKYYF